MKDRFKELSRIWFRTAQEDLLWAKHDFKAKFYSRVCFICQQVAEKALKAFLFSKKERLLKTHNLPLLNERCKKFNPTFSLLDSAVDILNQYYTDTRYPDIWDITRFEDEKLAKEALKLAEEILNFVSKKIK